MPDREWSTDDLLSELYQRQGFVIMGSHEPHEIGDIITEIQAKATNDRLHTPLVVRDVSTPAELHAQHVLIEELVGKPITAGPGEERYLFQYRVEAAD